MTLRNTKHIESYQFETAAELRDWLNQFQLTDLSTVHIQIGERDVLTFGWQEETLSDGSTVNNIIVS